MWDVKVQSNNIMPTLSMKRSSMEVRSRY